VLLRSPWRRLRVRIIAWSFVPSTIILCAVALVTIYAYQRVTEDLVLGRNQEVTRLSAGQLGTEVMQHADVLEGLARTSDIYRGSVATQQAALSAASPRLVVFDAGVLLINRYGRVVAAEPQRPDAIDQNWANRAYYHQMLRSAVVTFSDVVADGPGGSDVIVVAVPITGEQNEFEGVLAGMFHLGAGSVSSFYGGIVKLRIGDGGNTYLVDSAGRVIYHTDPQLIGSDASKNWAVQQVLSRKTSQLNVRDLDGGGTVASFAPVPGTPWGLITEESWDELMSSSQGYRQFLLILLAMGIAVPSLVVTLGVRRITGPIADLIAASKEVASGKFGQTISVRTGDELEELGNQFNLMSEQLQESYSDLERKVSGRTKELATLNEIAEVVSSSLDLDEILQNAMDKTLKAMELEEGGIYLLDEKAGDLVLALYRGMRPEVTDIVRRVSIGDGYSGRVAATGQLLVVDDISGDPRLASTSKATGGPASLASVPLIARGKVLGTFFATTVGRREFSKQELQLLTSIGRQIGVAIDNARLFSAEQRRAEQFRLINEAGRTITSILSVDELVKGIVQLVRDVLGYHIVMIALVEHDELVFRPELGADDGHSAVRLKIGGQGITSWVARTGEPVIVPDVTKEPRYVRIPPDSRTMSELAVPLKARESVIGVLDVGSEQLHAFDQSDLVVLQSLAYQAAVAIENARLYEQAQQLAVVEERNRLARDLHDSVTQAVYGVTLYAEAASRLLAAGNVTTAAEHLQDLRSTAQQALREMRSLIFELRPPVLEKEGLNAALQARLESVEGRAGVAAELKLEGTAPLSQELESGLYRIAQEALNNSLKHSQAHGVRLYLRRDEDIVILEVTDDGTGFDAEAGREHGGLGLRGMKERAAALGGKLDVQSTPGQGTTIRVEVNR
jgi:signal transduction histidine kinase/HAMP domain-containing protein